MHLCFLCLLLESVILFLKKLFKMSKIHADIVEKPGEAVVAEVSPLSFVMIIFWLKSRQLL